MSTPHINANKGDFADVVLMPGDPLRAKMIAKRFLRKAKLINDVRGMLAYTGYTKNGKRISVMGSGMGHGSIGIYSYELFNFYDVKAIIRVGSCGSYQKNINLKDVIIADTAVTYSNWGYQYGYDAKEPRFADKTLVKEAKKAAKEMNINAFSGSILSSDVFYEIDEDAWKKKSEQGILAVEMESYALYCNAQYAKKKALTLLTVSDSFFTPGVELNSKERQNSFADMINIAIKVAESIIK